MTDTVASDHARDNGASGEWDRYTGTGVVRQRPARLLPPPPWRSFSDGAEPIDNSPAEPPDDPAADAVAVRPVTDRPVTDRPGGARRARTYLPDPAVVELVNAALLLRRPLLVTGKPGTGKSTLADSVAAELGLGPVLNWPITSRTTLKDGLYSYDAIGRLHDANLTGARRPARPGAVGEGKPAPGRPAAAPPEPHDPVGADARDIGRYLRLGPLGTALLPRRQPRVLLIDELDKSDVDLPNDLLHVFEEGRFAIPELARITDEEPAPRVFTADGRERVPVTRGDVRCREFPLVIITSNGEREFPPAFLRRCLRLRIPPPDAAKLTRIVTAQLGPDAAVLGAPLIDRFVSLRDMHELATDQLLNAIMIVLAEPGRLRDPADPVIAAVLEPLNAGYP